MNILDIINNNNFIKKLYPNLKNFTLGNINLSNGRIYLDIHVFQKPDINVAKWGNWGTEYNVIVIQSIAQFTRNLSIENFSNHNLKPCKTRITKNGDYYKFNFKNENWQVEFEALTITFQECSTYIR